MSELQWIAVILAIGVAFYAVAYLKIDKQGGLAGRKFYFSLLFIFLFLEAISYFFLVHVAAGCEGQLCWLEEQMLWSLITAVLVISFPIIVFLKAARYKRGLENKR